VGSVKSKKRLNLFFVLTGLSVCAIIFSIVYFVRPKVITFNKSGILVEYTSNPALHSNGKDKAYGIKVIIYNDGTAEIINTPVVIRENKEIPSFSFTLNTGDVASLQDEIRATRFITLSRDLSTDSPDGSYRHIVVHTKINDHKAGGLNPGNKRFHKVEDLILSIVPEDVMKEYESAVDLYYSDEITFNESGYLVEFNSNSNCDYLGRDQIYGIRIVINNDGTSGIINVPEVVRKNKEIPSISFAVDASVVAGLQDEIRSTNFIALDDDVSSDSYDGSYEYITVHTQTKVHKSGGLNPTDEQFCKFKDLIWSIVPEDVMKEYDTAVELYYSD